MCQVSLGRTVANQRDWKTPIKTIAIFRVEGKDQKQKWSLGENTLQSHISFLATLTVNKIKKTQDLRSIRGSLEDNSIAIHCLNSKAWMSKWYGLYLEIIFYSLSKIAILSLGGWTKLTLWQFLEWLWWKNSQLKTPLLEFLDEFSTPVIVKL